MSRNVRTYDHFCMVARALEHLGDRWTLLVVRDLLGIPRRFSDLQSLLSGITPKTLTQRLRELERNGLVEVDRQPGRREVWYRLTPAGEELAPLIESLLLWGLRHAGRSPLPGETVHAEHLLSAVRIALDQAPPPRRPLTWRFDITDDRSFTLRSDQDGWSLLHDADPDEAPDVVVTADTAAWTRFLMTPPDQRSADHPGLDLNGTPAQIDRFLHHLAAFPYTLATTPA